MKFTTLKIENFLAISSAEVKLDNRGLVLIQGVNEDDSSAISNGAGKSSIADALCWCLHGTTARGDSGDSVVNTKAGKGTRVEVTIEDGADRYVIARHRKHKTGKNSLTVIQHDVAGATDLTKGTDKLTQVVVDKIIGASHDVFRAAIYAAQEQMPDLPAMTDKALKVMIEEASGVTVLEAAYKEARLRLAAAQAAVDNEVAAQQAIRSRQEFVDQQIITVTAARDTWRIDQTTRIAALRAEISRRLANIKSLDADIALIDVAAIKDGLADCDARLAALGGEQKKLRDHQRVVSLSSAEQATYRHEVHRLRAEYDDIKQQIADLEATIGRPCNECGRDHDKTTIAVHRDALVKKGSDIAARFKSARASLDDAHNRTQKLTSELQDFEASMTDPSVITGQRASLQAQSDALQTLIARRSAEMSRTKSLGDEAKRLAGETNPHEASIAALEKQRAELESKEKALSVIIGDKETERDVVKTVVDVFSPAGVRAQILDEVTPYLNDQTTRYLDALSDGNIQATWSTLVKNAKGDLTEKFSIEVENDKGGKRFSSLSGGEKRKVRIATALALQDLVATRAAKPIDLFIGDEIDDALDPAGLERLTQILAEKAKERGSVFVISHSDLKDWISQVLTIRKKDGETTVTEESV